MSRKVVLAVAMLVLAIFFVAPMLYSQADITYLSEEEFVEKQRPATYFPHDEHNAKADLEDRCYLCHHLDGSDPHPEAMSVGTPCSGCHEVEPEDADETPLRSAYHDLCQDCHAQEQAGPIACGECHVR